MQASIWQRTTLHTAVRNNLTSYAGARWCPGGDKHSLAMVQRRLNTDILVTGHTHEFQANIPLPAMRDPALCLPHGPVDAM